MSISAQNSRHIDFDTTQWLSPTEICRELQIPLQTFYQWRVKGIGPRAYRFGRHLRIDRRDFNDWLQMHFDGTHSVPAVEGLG